MACNTLYSCLFLISIVQLIKCEEEVPALFLLSHLVSEMKENRQLGTDQTNTNIPLPPLSRAPRRTHREFLEQYLRNAKRAYLGAPTELPYTDSVVTSKKIRRRRVEREATDDDKILESILESDSEEEGGLDIKTLEDVKQAQVMMGVDKGNQRVTPNQGPRGALDVTGFWDDLVNFFTYMFH